MVQQLIPGLRVLEPSFLEVRHVVRAGERDPEPRHALPPGLRPHHFGREGIPAAALLADLLDDVVDVDELVLVEEGIGTGRAEHVVTRLRLRLGGELGRHLQVGDRVDAHRAVGQLPERLRLLAQLVVGGRDEVIPAEERQLALLGERRRPAEGEPRRHAGRAPGCGAEEITTRRCPHRAPPGGTDRTVARFYHPVADLVNQARVSFRHASARSRRTRTRRRSGSGRRARRRRRARRPDPRGAGRGWRPRAR